MDVVRRVRVAVLVDDETNKGNRIIVRSGRFRQRQVAWSGIGGGEASCLASGVGVGGEASCLASGGGELLASGGGELLVSGGGKAAGGETTVVDCEKG